MTTMIAWYVTMDSCAPINTMVTNSYQQIKVTVEDGEITRETSYNAKQGTPRSPDSIFEVSGTA